MAAFSGSLQPAQTLRIMPRIFRQPGAVFGLYGGFAPPAAGCKPPLPFVCRTFRLRPALRPLPEKNPATNSAQRRLPLRPAAEQSNLCLQIPRPPRFIRRPRRAAVGRTARLAGPAQHRDGHAPERAPAAPARLQPKPAAGRSPCPTLEFAASAAICRETQPSCAAKHPAPPPARQKRARYFSGSLKCRC